MLASNATTARFAVNKSRLLAEAVELAERLDTFAFRKEKNLPELDVKAARSARRIAKLLRSMQSSSATPVQTLDWLTPLRAEALQLLGD